MHVAKISRRHGEREYNSYLVRRSIREGRRVRHETVANVSRLPREAIEALTLALGGCGSCRRVRRLRSCARASTGTWRRCSMRLGGWAWRGCLIASPRASGICAWR